MWRTISIIYYFYYHYDSYFCLYIYMHIMVQVDLSIVLPVNVPLLVKDLEQPPLLFCIINKYSNLMFWVYTKRSPQYFSNHSPWFTGVLCIDYENIKIYKICLLFVHFTWEERADLVIAVGTLMIWELLALTARFSNVSIIVYNFVCPYNGVTLNTFLKTYMMRCNYFNF